MLKFVCMEDGAGAALQFRKSSNHMNSPLADSSFEGIFKPTVSRSDCSAECFLEATAAVTTAAEAQ